LEGFPKLFGYRGLKPPVYTALMLAVLALAFAQRNGQPSNRYVGDAACRKCHATAFQNYARVSMSRSFETIAGATPIEDWTGRNRLYHKPSDQYFVMTAHDGRFFQRRYQLDTRGNEVNSLELEIQYAIGSGNHERDYIHRLPSGEFVQFPVVWYAAEKRWGMAPGYDRPDHDGFSRRINYRCIFCHAGYPDISSGADRSESQLSLFPQVMPSGVSCERCHGPGQLHASNTRAESIVNPAKLDRKHQMDVCLQCHLETTSAALPNSVLKVGRDIFSFRAGEALESYAAYFDYPKGAGHDDDFNIVHQGYGLAKSQCFVKSSMTCLTCHDPHRPADNPQTFYNAKCATCHRMDVRVHGEDCVGCHMPKRRTDDIVHVIMSDHYIQRRPPNNLLSPKPERTGDRFRGALSFYAPEPERDLYMGLALARGANVTGGVELLERAVNRQKSAEPLFQLAGAYANLGKRELAVDAYSRGLKMDPAHAEARYNMAISLMDLGKLKEAEEALREALREKPEMADAYVVLGTIEVRLGHTEAGRTDYLQALKFDPLNTVALNNLGLMELQLGKTDAARGYFSEVLKIKPDDATARQGLLRK